MTTCCSLHAGSSRCQGICTGRRSALARRRGPAQTPAAPGQASGPIVLHGVSPRLTVHALDTFHGAAATGLRIDFFRLEGASYKLIRTVTANANGRSGRSRC